MIAVMEATSAQPKAAREPKVPAQDRDLAIRFGAVMMHILGSGGGEFMRALDESGLTFVQMKAMLCVAGEEDPAPVKLIAERLDVSVASASRAVESLVKRGLVTRIEDASDRRVRRVSLTPPGRELAGRIFATRIAGLERFVTGLNAGERRKLEAAVEMLLEREEIAGAYKSHARRLRG